MKPVLAVLIFLCATALPASAQTYGDVVGRVRAVAGRQVGLNGARVEVVGTTLSAITDYKGRYRIHAVPAGQRTLKASVAGFAPASQPTVPVYAGTETLQDFFLARDAAEEAPQIPAPVIDPSGRGAHERVDATDLALRPFTDQEDLTTRWSDATGVGYWAGRPGAQALMIDGMSLRSVYDGSTAPLGLRLPLSMLEDASLTMDPGTGPRGLSGVQRLVTADADDRWDVRGTYRTDRPVSGDADFGFDQILLHASGPAGNVRVVAALDAKGLLRSETFSAPRGDSAAPAPWELGHNEGERIDAAAKIRLPLGPTNAVHLFAVRSVDQRSIFDPVFKYDPGPGAGRRLDATLLAAELRRVSPAWSGSLRVRYFARDFAQSDLAEPVSPAFGGLGGTYRFKAMSIAESQDTSAARAALPGFSPPALSTMTPWGVGAFFRSGGSRGAVLWNSLRELTLEFAATTAPSRAFTLSADAGVSLPRVHAFQRALAFLPVGDSVPPATTAMLSPIEATAGTRVELRGSIGTLIAQARADVLAPRSAGTRSLVTGSPMIEAAIPFVGGAISLVVGQQNQFPDLQFRANLAFDDSLVAGRFRRGNSALRQEKVTFGLIGYRRHVWRDAVIQASFYRRRFEDLIASTTGVSADSSMFSNRDSLDVTGAQVVLDKGLGSRSRITATYGVEIASFGAVNGLWITDTSATSAREETISRLILTARGPLPAAFDGAGQLYLATGAPFSQVPKAQRNTQLTIDLRVRRAFKLGGADALLYVDVRNLLGNKPVVAITRLSGTPGLDAATIDSLAQAAYAANPGTIGYESPRYRTFADLDNNGLIEGATELLPLYELAASDYGQPLRAYGPPRTVRFGIEVGLR